MLRRKSKIAIGLISTGAILAISVPLAVISAKKINDNNKKDISKDPVVIEDKLTNIFPELSKNKYYEFVEYENGEGKINKNIVPAVLKDVMSSIKQTKGSLSMDYEFINNGINIHFKYTHNSQEVYKTYTFTAIKEQ